MCEKSYGEIMMDMFPAEEIARNIDMEVIKSAKALATAEDIAEDLSLAEKEYKEEYKKAQRERTLRILNELNDLLDTMTDEELYEHMMKTSPSFRETMRKFDKFIEEKEKEEAN